MKLIDEHLRSYVDEVKNLGLLKWITYEGDDICATWYGKHAPATRSNDEEMADMARFSREHYLLYLWFVANHMERKGDVLDIGCGSGHRTNMLSRYSTCVWGIDSDSEKLRFATKGNGGAGIIYLIGMYPRDMAPVVPKMTFDYIFASEIIEHVPLDDQPAFLDFSLGSLKPGGKMFITCPNDKVVERKHPHVGLWEPEQFQSLLGTLGSRVIYHGYADISGLNRDSDATLADLYVGDRPSDHYLMVLG